MKHVESPGAQFENEGSFQGEAIGGNGIVAIGLG